MQARDQGVHGVEIIHKQTQAQPSGQLVQPRHLPRVYRKGDGQILPARLGELPRHSQGGNRPGIDAQIPKNRCDSCGLVGLEVRPQDDIVAPGPFYHAPRVAAHLLGIHDEARHLNRFKHDRSRLVGLDLA